MENLIDKRRLRYAGHVLRYPPNRHLKTSMSWIPPQAKRSRGRPRHTWRRSFKEDLRRLGIDEEDAERNAADRDKWRKMVDQFIDDDDGGTKV